MRHLLVVFALFFVFNCTQESGSVSNEFPPLSSVDKMSGSLVGSSGNLQWNVTIHFNDPVPHDLELEWEGCPSGALTLVDPVFSNDLVVTGVTPDTSGAMHISWENEDGTRGTSQVWKNNPDHAGGVFDQVSEACQ